MSPRRRKDTADADFEARLLAFLAQNTEVARLAGGFGQGFQGSPYTYNLKDLLVEIVLSQWFRVDALADANPVRRAALLDAGARRLLTPEELAGKTAAITGVQWGRRVSGSPRDGRLTNSLTQDYRLLYGGIDSDGIIERARDVTSVMAGVAKRHAAAVGCSVVARELYLLPDEERRLFAGIDPLLNPISEFGSVFEIESATWDSRQNLSLNGALTAGTNTVVLTYQNPLGGRVVRLDRLDVVNTTGQVVRQPRDRGCRVVRGRLRRPGRRSLLSRLCESGRS